MSTAVQLHQDEGEALPAVLTSSTALMDPALEFVQTLPQRWQLAKILFNSGMSRQKSAEGVMAVVLKGYELGIPPMAALSNVDFFDGNFCIRAHAQLAIASARHGVRCQTLESTATVCRLRLTRPDWEPVEESFTIEEARSANLLNKNNWKTYPKDMLYNRALSRGIKRVCPEVGAGVYDPDEVGQVTMPASEQAEPTPARQTKRELAEAAQQRATAERSPADAAEEFAARGDAADQFVPEDEVLQLRAEAVARGANKKFLAHFDAHTDGPTTRVVFEGLSADLDRHFPAIEREPGEEG